MAHRGRLNVLANIMGKSPQEIFREFDDIDPEAAPRPRRREVPPGLQQRLDDRGRPARSTCRCASIPATWNSSTRWPWAACGPSRTASATSQRERGMALLIHGDAAFAGEGIVQETLNLSQLDGYTPAARCTSSSTTRSASPRRPPKAARATYATDVAKMLQIPIFHVNGEDPEAVAQVVRLAMDFRHEFQRDVVIDMYCYRRRGHNEGDEPAFTQPVLYQAIDERKSVRDSYLDHLLELGEHHARGGRPDRRASAAAARTRNCRVARSDEYVRAAADADRASGRAIVGGPRRRRRRRRHRRRSRSGWPSCCEAQTRRAGRLSSASEDRAVARSARAKWPRGEQPLDWAAGRGAGVRHAGRARASAFA